MMQCSNWFIGFRRLSSAFGTAMGNEGVRTIHPLAVPKVTTQLMSAGVTVVILYGLCDRCVRVV